MGNPGLAACGEGCVFETPGPFLWCAERIRVGRNVRIHREVRLQVNLERGDERSDPWIDLGDDVVIGAGCQISASAGIVIGARTRLGDEVLVLDNTHEYEDPHKPIQQQPVKIGGPVRIGERAYIGRGAVILPGINVGDGAVIMDRAVVRENIPPGAWVAGSPAKRLKRSPGTREE
jgi:acetyltransferase-like isoleucine patch superfamily enzyme